jgi:hypothetical protein
MKIAVIDGQGGGIGSVLVKRMRDAFQERVEIIALGTNAIATAQMVKAGANKGATGENAIAVMVRKVDFIVGPIAVVLADAMMGEVTPAMAVAVASSPARKFLLPLTQEAVEVVGVVPEPLPHLVEQLIDKRLRPLVEGME